VVQAHTPRPAEIHGGHGPPVIFVVDDDDSIRGAIRAVLEDDGREVQDMIRVRRSWQTSGRAGKHVW